MYVIRTIMAAVLLAAPFNAALACSCARNPTAQSLHETASAIFTGTVTDDVAAGTQQSVTTFRITESFKGAPAGTTVRVAHPSGASASCGVKFARGESYTLAAHPGGTRAGLSTTLCSTWMFQPNVGLSQSLIEGLRALRQRR